MWPSGSRACLMPPRQTGLKGWKSPRRNLARSCRAPQRSAVPLRHRHVHGSHAICIGDVTGISDAGEKPLTYMSGSFHIVRPKQAT